MMIATNISSLKCTLTLNLMMSLGTKFNKTNIVKLDLNSLGIFMSNSI